MLDFKKIVADETQAYFDLLRVIYSQSEYFCDCFEEKYPSSANVKKEIEDINKLPGGFILVAYKGQKMVGFLKIAPTPNAHLAHTAWLTVGVLEEARGKGIAKGLLRTAEEYIREFRKTEILYLMVRADNKPAIEMNMKAGYDPIAILPNDTKIKGRYYDGIMMRKMFNHQVFCKTSKSTKDFAVRLLRPSPAGLD